MKRRTLRTANVDKKESDVRVGDMLMWKDPRMIRGTDTKLKRRFRGPFKVLEVFGTGCVSLDVGKEGIRRVPLNQLGHASSKR